MGGEIENVNSITNVEVMLSIWTQFMVSWCSFSALHEPLSHYINIVYWYIFLLYLRKMKGLKSKKLSKIDEPYLGPDLFQNIYGKIQLLNYWTSKGTACNHKKVILIKVLIVKIWYARQDLLNLILLFQLVAVDVV